MTDTVGHVYATSRGRGRLENAHGERVPRHVFAGVRA
jgi:hypothetical protein